MPAPWPAGPAAWRARAEGWGFQAAGWGGAGGAGLEERAWRRCGPSSGLGGGAAGSGALQGAADPGTIPNPVRSVTEPSGPLRQGSHNAQPGPTWEPVFIAIAAARW